MFPVNSEMIILVISNMLPVNFHLLTMTYAYLCKWVVTAASPRHSAGLCVFWWADEIWRILPGFSLSFMCLVTGGDAESFYLRVFWIKYADVKWVRLVMSSEWGAFKVWRCCDAPRRPTLRLPPQSRRWVSSVTRSDWSLLAQLN